MAEPDHEQIAEQLENDLASMERHSRELQGDLEAARSEWERKRGDPSVPGAPPAQTGGQEPETEFPAKDKSLESD